MVGDALIVAPEQGDVDRRLNPVSPAVVEEHPELRAPQEVHLLVLALQLPSRLEVALGQDSPAACTMSWATAPMRARFSRSSAGTADSGYRSRATFAT